VIPLTPAGPDDLDDVTEFLRTADLTLSGLDSKSLHLWIGRNLADGRIFATTGFEPSDDLRHVLIRSVAVGRESRGNNMGTELALFALQRATELNATTAWLFSRRSGPFWQKLGFVPADREELARSLASTHQVQLFARTGQLDREVAWSRPL
jgi:N-acetylglutamate synthase-like GNAT family acetyltransferase